MAAVDLPIQKLQTWKKKIDNGGHITVFAMKSYSAMPLYICCISRSLRAYMYSMASCRTCRLQALLQFFPQFTSVKGTLKLCKLKREQGEISEREEPMCASNIGEARDR